MKIFLAAILLSVCAACEPVSVLLWHGDCADHTVFFNQPVGSTLADGRVLMPTSAATVARVPRDECGGSWAALALTPTGEKYGGLFIYGGTNLAPPR